MHMSDGYIGTSWWCWGDLESDLRDKSFHAWQKGINFLDTPFPADPDNWALGEGPSELKFEDHSGWVSLRLLDDSNLRLRSIYRQFNYSNAQNRYPWLIRSIYNRINLIEIQVLAMSRKSHFHRVE